MEKKIQIVLGEHYEEFIAQQLVTGSFESVSEVVREGLRLLEERQEKMGQLQVALRMGIG